MHLCDWAIVGDLVELSFPDGSFLRVKKIDFDRAFGAIISATKEDVLRDFAVNG